MEPGEAGMWGGIATAVGSLFVAWRLDRKNKREHETTETKVEIELFERVSERETARLISDNERLRDDVESLRARLDKAQEAAANARAEAFAEAARMNRAAMVQALEELNARDDDASTG